MELIKVSTLVAFDISNISEEIVVIGALEVKSPLGSSEPVTTIDSMTGCVFFDLIADRSTLSCAANSPAIKLESIMSKSIRTYESRPQFGHE
tara:strand:- start:205 stop:480 length:276 start_codon:yes stop_codon:yes gene_type:complete